MTSEPHPSLYDTLLQNFEGELVLHSVSEDQQYILSVLDNLRRILNSRAGSLSHLPDYGLPDMGQILQGLPASAHSLMGRMSETLCKYEPRLADLHIRLLPQVQAGQLHYALDIRLKGGRRVVFGTTLGAEGRVWVRHLKQQEYLA